MQGLGLTRTAQSFPLLDPRQGYLILLGGYLGTGTVMQLLKARRSRTYIAKILGIGWVGILNPW